MKTADMLILAGAAAFAYYLLRNNKIALAKVGTANYTGNEVLNSALPGEPGYGWSYWDSGVAISPTGDYYKNGQLVFKVGQ